MKTILTALLVLLSMTSCKKKECERANQQVLNQVYEVQMATYNHLVENTQSTAIVLQQTQQQYEQYVSSRDKICN